MVLPTIASSAVPVNAKANEPLQLAVNTAPSNTLDATSIGPPPQQSMRPNIKYIETTSNNAPTSDEEFSRLPTCPKPAATNCPDLNGNGRVEGPNGSDKTCPNICVVKKIQVYPKEITGVELEDKTIKVYETNGSVTQAFCPPTYSSVGVFDMQLDQSYYSPGPSVTNIKSLASLDKLKAAGYDCHGNGTTQFTRRPQEGQSWNTGNYCPGNFLGLAEDDIATWTAEYTANVKKLDDQYDAAVKAGKAANPPYDPPLIPGSTKWTEKINQDYLAAVKYAYENNLPIPPQPSYDAGLGLSIKDPIPMINATHFGTPDVVYLTDYKDIYHSCKGSCSGCVGWIVDINFQAFYQVAMCTAPPGYYPTNSKSPHGTVCARVRSEWKSLQDTQ